MSLTYALKNIKGGSWYRQGGSMNSFFVSMPYISVFKEIGYNNIFIIQKGNWNMGYLEKTQERKKVEEFLKKYFKNTDNLDKIIKNWRKLNKDYKKKLKEVLSLEFGKDSKIEKILKEYCQSAINAWRIAIIIEFLDPWGEYFIEKYSKRYNLSHEEISILTSPKNYSYLQNELIDRFKIAKAGDLSKVKEHYKKYYWYLSSWQSAEFTDIKYFEKLIKKTIKNINQTKEEVDEIIKNKKFIERKRKEIINKYKFDKKTRDLFNLFSRLNDWRDERKKEQVCKINYELYKLQQKIAKFNNLSMNLASYINLIELKSFKITKEYIKILEKRSKVRYVMYGDEHHNFKWAYGKEAEIIYNALERKIRTMSGEIIGKIASRGKVRGRVRVIDSISDFKKMNKGDILVSIMTRPELMPVIKKAGAIITDEGGITCHAAIVSRELKIPCIVGTQSATQVLKDGDLVEVDAEKGIVKKIK